MKQFVLTVCALMASLMLVAQDIIVTKDAKKIEDKNQLKFNEAINAITGKIEDRPIESQPTSAENIQESLDSDQHILLFVVGLEDSLQMARQIIESEFINKINSIEGYLVQKFNLTLNDNSEQKIIDVAISKQIPYVCVVKILPFQSEYYIQANVIDAKTSRSIASASSALLLSSVSGIVKTTDEIAAQLSEPLKNKRANEIAEEEQRLETEYAVQEILRQQEQEAQKQREKQENIFNIFNDEVVEVYFLTIENTKKYSCKVIVAGEQIGIVNPYTTQRFIVPTHLFGRIQIVQVSGNKGRAAESVYYVPKQDHRAMISLSNED